MSNIKILELFGGIGAPRKALENIGYSVDSTYVEIDKFATKSYNAMFDENNSPSSVTDFDGMNKNYDLLFHGSPCQDFSVAGTQQGADEGSGTRSSLMWETVRIIEQCLPPIVIWENVKAVTNKNHVDTFNKYLSKLENLGYTNSFRILNSSDFGIPQERERLFVVSLLGDKSFNFDNINTKKMRLLRDIVTDDETGKEFILKSPSMLGCLAEGKLRILDLNNDNQKTTTITTKQMRWDSSCVPIENNSYRLLTPLECWRLMGFSDEDYYRAMTVTSRTQLYKQAGNSIVVPVLEEIFKELLK